jgi:hypothetical protein
MQMRGGKVPSIQSLHFWVLDTGYWVIFCYTDTVKEVSVRVTAR